MFVVDGLPLMEIIEVEFWVVRGRYIQALLRCRLYARLSIVASLLV